MKHRQQPNIAHSESFDLIPQSRGLATEILAIPLQCGIRVGTTQVDVMETECVVVLDQLNSRTPGIKNEPVFEQARNITERRTVLETL